MNRFVAQTVHRYFCSACDAIESVCQPVPTLDPKWIIMPLCKPSTWCEVDGRLFCGRHKLTLTVRTPDEGHVVEITLP